MFIYSFLQTKLTYTLIAALEPKGSKLHILAQYAHFSVYHLLQNLFNIRFIGIPITFIRNFFFFVTKFEPK